MDNTWIVVADSSHARIFQLRDGQLPAEEIEDLANPLGRADNRQLASDSHGQFAGPEGRGHTAPRVEEPVQHEVRQFARQICHLLDKAAGQQRYRRLALVAAPRFLGLLRESMDKNTRKLVSAEVAKNVSAFAREDLDACLQALARPPLPG